jgi:hypothetical protein
MQTPVVGAQRSRSVSTTLGEECAALSYMWCRKLCGSDEEHHQTVFSFKQAKLSMIPFYARLPEDLYFT